MGKASKLGYGFLFVGAPLPYLLEHLFVGATHTLIATVGCFVVGIVFLCAGHIHKENENPPISLLRKILTGILAMIVISGICYAIWRVPTQLAKPGMQNGGVSQNKDSEAAQSVPQVVSSGPSKDPLVAQREKPKTRKENSPVRANGILRGNDNTVVGGVPYHAIHGNGNTVVGATDANGNTILNRGGTAIGNGARAGRTGVAIGAHANAEDGLKSPQTQTTNDAPNGIAISGGNVVNPTVNNFGLPRPPPRFHFEQRHLSPIARDPPSSDPSINRANFIARMSEGRLNDGNPGVDVMITLDDAADSPVFWVQCSSSCALKDIRLEGSFQIQQLWFSGANRIGFRLIVAQQLPAGTKIPVEIRSTDARDVTILDVGTYIEPN